MNNITAILVIGECNILVAIVNLTDFRVLKLRFITALLRVLKKYKPEYS